MKTVVAILCLMCSNIASAQTNYFGEAKTLNSKKLLEINMRKMGPYFGFQQGRVGFLEIGGEVQWKKIRLKNPRIHAMNAGFNYNIKHKVLGFDAGYWYKPHRVGLTYGGHLFYKTDFVSTRIGIAPALGFKFWFLHLQTGYHFMGKRESVFETNTFFISLRMGIVNDRKFDVKRKKPLFGK